MYESQRLPSNNTQSVTTTRTNTKNGDGNDNKDKKMKGRKPKEDTSKVDPTGT